jgi:hypothetical protein
MRPEIFAANTHPGTRVKAILSASPTPEPLREVVEQASILTEFGIIAPCSALGVQPHDSGFRKPEKEKWPTVGTRWALASLAGRQESMRREHRFRRQSRKLLVDRLVAPLP